MKNILQEYEICSRQCVQFTKSYIFYSSNTLSKDRRDVKSILDMCSSFDIKRYLGLPTFVGRRKRATFQSMKDYFNKCVTDWNIRFLSKGVQEVFVKAVLHAISTYSMACFIFPKSLCDDLEKFTRKFWWQKRGGRKCLHWCEWSRLCFPKEIGGMGF